MDQPKHVIVVGCLVHPINRDRLQTLLEFDGRIVYRAYTPKPYLFEVETFLT